LKNLGVAYQHVITLVNFWLIIIQMSTGIIPFDSPLKALSKVFWDQLDPAGRWAAKRRNRMKMAEEESHLTGRVPREFPAERFVRSV
jgi:hypothetical protein